MRKNTYKDFSYINDICDLTKNNLTSENVEQYEKICNGLSEPMVYWQMRWWHRGFIVAAFIIGFSIGVPS